MTPEELKEFKLYFTENEISGLKGDLTKYIDKLLQKREEIYKQKIQDMKQKLRDMMIFIEMEL